MKHRTVMLLAAVVAVLGVVLFASGPAKSDVPATGREASAPKYTTQVVRIPETQSTGAETLVVITDCQEQKLHVYREGLRNLNLSYTVDLTQAGQREIPTARGTDGSTRPSEDAATVEERMRKRRDDLRGQ